jgi:hypothetical protein
METSTLSEARDTNSIFAGRSPENISLHKVTAKVWNHIYIHGVIILPERVPLGFVFLTVLMLIADAIIALLTELANSGAYAM